MGDTIKLPVTEDWQAIPDLVLGRSYNVQNGIDELMYLAQQSTTPAPTATGFKLLPAKSAILIKEENSVFIRLKAGSGTAYINEIL